MEAIRGQLYSNLSFGEVNRRFYGRKFCFTATIINTGIPVPMHFLHFHFSKCTTLHPTQVILAT